GYCGDACMTFGVGQISAEAQRVLDVAQECLRIGIAAAQLDNHLNDIGHALSLGIFFNGPANIIQVIV
ncbi:MAG: M24 family metallopeptidase, partial [Chloroflexota bacterium]